ncbi:Transcription initiation factor TFIID subunit 5, partial [Kappamyces sp. JEL0680]
MGLVGTDTSLAAFNQQQVRLGKTAIDQGFYQDIERALGKQIHSDGGTLLEQVRAVLNAPRDDDGPALEDVPFPPKKLSDITAELNALRDVRARVSLGDKTLPSICCYTFHNAADTLNCLRASANADYIAAGFADSFVKLWSVASTKPDVPAAPPANLVGHSGAVFALDFSPDASHLLSCSEDKSVRLWSVETRSNLVVYKGHNYPVFDVVFSPNGYYFATASLDRTARLWSVDHLFPLRLFVGHLSDVD